MKKIVVVGIDLAGVSRRPTGACCLREFDASTALLFEDRDILEFIRRQKPDLVAIDAPLNLPPGRRSIEDRNGAHFRPCDLELRRHKIPFFPITLGPMRALTVRGIALRRLLEKQALRRIEGGRLTDEEVERLGLTFLRLAERMKELQGAFNLKDEDLNLNLGPLGDLM